MLVSLWLILGNGWFNRQGDCPCGYELAFTVITITTVSISPQGVAFVTMATE